MGDPTATPAGNAHRPPRGARPEWLEDQPRNDGDLGAWVEFIRLLTQHHIRYDIDLEFDLPVFSVGEYDIEIEVEAP